MMMNLPTGLEWVLKTSLEATVVIGLVLLAQRLLRRHLNARWRAALWLLVLARMCLPIGPTAPWSLFQVTHPAVSIAALDHWRPVAGVASAPIATPDNAYQVLAAPDRVSESVSRWVAWVWLAGTSVLLLRLISQNARFSKALRFARPINDAVTAELVREGRERFRVRDALRVVETDAVGGPALYGLFGWRLLLPVGLWPRLTLAERRHVLWHELAHLKRRDPWANWLFVVLRAAHWFNPLVWYAYRCFRRDRELACDESVLSVQSSGERLGYGSTLIRLLELESSTQPLNAPAWRPAVTGILDGKDQIEERITMIAQFVPQTRRPVVGIGLLLALGLLTLTDAGPQSNANTGPATTSSVPTEEKSVGRTAAPPRIASTEPVIGATDVNPALKEITVTFDGDMGEGYSWTGGGPEYPPTPDGQRVYWRDRRTCVLPVSLQPGKFYRVGVNSTSYQNFRSAEGVPAQPAAIYFTTRGAGADQVARSARPRIVQLQPPNGAQGVDAKLTELRVTFDTPMGKGFSWTGGGPQFPTIPEGKRPYWTNDGKTCVLPVQLQPGWQYRLGLNSPSHKNFQSASGVPLEPLVYTFKTK